MFASKSVTPPPDFEHDEEIFERMDAFEIAEPEKCTMSVRLQFPKFAHGFKPSDFEQFVKCLVGAENVVSLGRLSFPNEWQLSLKTTEVREKLIRMGRTKVNGRTCWIHPLSHSEIRGYVHWLPTEIPDEKVKEKLRSFGEVLFMEVQNVSKWDLQIKSDSRYFALYLSPGTAADDLPHFITIYGHMGLITVKGRPPACFHCREIGHKKTECKKYRERLSEYCMRPARDPPVPRKRGRRNDGIASENECGNLSKKRKCVENTPNIVSREVKDEDAVSNSKFIESRKIEDEVPMQGTSNSASMVMDVEFGNGAASGGAKPKKKKKKKNKNKKKSFEACNSANIRTDEICRNVGEEREKVQVLNSADPDSTGKFVSEETGVISRPFGSVLVSNFAEEDSCSSCALSETMEVPASSLDFNFSVNESDIAVIGKCSTTEIVAGQTTSSNVDSEINSVLPVENAINVTVEAMSASKVLCDEAAAGSVEVTPEFPLKDANSDVALPSCALNPPGDATVENSNLLKVEPLLSEDAVNKTFGSKVPSDTEHFIGKDPEVKDKSVEVKDEACNENFSDNKLNKAKENMHVASNAQKDASSHDSISNLSETLKSVTIEESGAAKSEEGQQEPKSTKKGKKKKKKRKTAIS